MNVFITYIKRNSFLCSLLLFFLALSVVFGSLGFLAWSGTQRQLQEIGSQYILINACVFSEG